MSYPRNSGGVWYFFVENGFATLRERLDALRQIGAKYVRLWFPWSEIERSEGSFDFSYVENIISNIVTSGLMVDITLCPVMAPTWFWAKHPDAHMLNEKQEHFKPQPSRVQSAPISYWHPQLKVRYRQFIKESFNESLNHWSPFIHFIRISMGRLNEPTYPDKQHFWCYDQHAQRDFKKSMKARYHDDIAELNRKWSTDFTSFQRINVPKPGDFRVATQGQRRDFIHWYRDSKDSFVLWAIRELKAKLENHQRIVVFPTGSGDADNDIDKFIEDGTVTPILKHMERNFWLLKQCQEQNLCAQYAGVGVNAARAGSFARRLIDHHKSKAYQFPLYAQIPALKTRTGQPNNPERVGQLIASQGYYGFAWSKDRDLFDTKRRKNRRFGQLRKAFKIIEEAYGGDYVNPLIDKIVVSFGGSRRARIAWTTDKPCESVVIYGKRSGFIKRVSQHKTALKTRHEITLERLEPEVRYYFVVAGSDKDGNFSCSKEMLLENTSA